MFWDIYLFRSINELAGRSEALDAIGIFAAIFLLPIMVFLVLLAAFTVKKIKEEKWYELPIKAGLAVFIGYAIRFIIGEIVGRGRPFAQLSDVNQLVPMNSFYDSFPSGHATAAFALAFIVLKTDRDWGIAFMSLAMAVSIARIFTGLHFPLDIAGGFIVGGGSAWLINRFEHRHWNKIEHALRIK